MEKHGNSKHIDGKGLKPNLSRIVLVMAASLLIMAMIICFSSGFRTAVPEIIVAFLFLAIGFRNFTLLKGFSFTLLICAAVTTSLSYPDYFISYHGFKFALLITPLIQIIMFGMGTSMHVKDFVNVLKMPKGVFIGVFSHFLIMPLLGLTLASISGFKPEIAAGIILIGCSPNGMASNVISYLAKANLALSVTITAVSTLLAPLITPLLMKMLAGAFIDINVENMMFDIAKMVIVPIVLGLIFNRLLRHKQQWVEKIMPLISMSGIAFIIMIITAAGHNSLLDIGFKLILLVMIHNLTGYVLGYWSGRLFKMEERDCRTMAIEVGMQNGGLASAIAKEMGKMATVGLAPAVFGPLMNITGSLLASYWHRKPTKDEVAYTAPSH
ncbi:bile acid:sodium symporter family protein [Pedobacter sp. MR22-3]|uniref:bile acid:sodium symporter family protein n=1 Tax=Pedobacter sp. MR22-3 TaxID=2994552 RepID=UPI0022462067|nr:bile acid:sodium symporter family protein [Pedobacter sp. MR22-3]MCX2585836.1 bile acid:sodium symporter family protein [Pedobacter sp. MR22-3]